MRKISFLLVLLSVVIGTMAQETYRKGEVIVKFKAQAGVEMTVGANAARGRTPSAKSKAVNGLLQRLGASEVRQLMPLTGAPQANARGRNGGAVQTDLSQLCLLRFDETKGSVEDVITALKQLDEVEYAEPNRILHLMATDADTYKMEPRFCEQWALQAIRMPELWAQPIINSKRPVIAILDSGVDVNHPDLKDNLLEGYNAYDSSTNVTDNVGHGTHCAGLAAATGNNNTGITGANPNAKILPIKIADSNDAIDMAAEIRAVAYAVEKGADIISMSFGYSDNAPAQAELEALEAASHSAILVAAAGNDNKCMVFDHACLHGANPHPTYPAAFSFVIGVESSTPSGRLAEDSNYDCDGPLYTSFTEGYNFEVRAPGYDILSTLPNSDYGYMSGTSMACPLVAGAISRLLQCRDFTDYRTMVRTLIESSNDCVDIMAAYLMTDEQLNAETFTLDIDNVTMTFHKTSDNTVEIGNGSNPAISTSTVGSIVIPQIACGYLVTGIADNAFNGCSGLTSIVIPYTIASIGSCAFLGCSGLKYLQPLHLLANELPANCANDAFSESQFATCSIEVAENYVGVYQTADVWKLFDNIQKPQYAIGDVLKETIDGVEQLFTITSLAPRTVEISGFTRKIGNVEDVLTKADSVSVRIPSDVQGFAVTKIGRSAFGWCCEMESLEIPESVTEIGGGAFYCCWGLRSLHIPASVKYIENISVLEGYGFETFWNMASLESVSVAGDNPNYSCPEGKHVLMETVSHTLLLGCKNTIIPEGTTRIGPCAFSHQNIGSIILPEGITIIDEKAFYHAHITDITLPESLRKIGYWGLAGNHYLQEIKLPPNLEYIDREAISSNMIRTLEIPASVKSIGQWAFVGCSYLRNVVVNNREPIEIPHEQTTDVFHYYVDEYSRDFYPYDHFYDLAVLYVPQGCKAAYQNAEGWKQFKNIVEISDVLPGDVDGNGVLDDMDRQVMEAYLIRMYGVTDPNFYPTIIEPYLKDYLEGNALPDVRDLAADLNSDGEIDFHDYVILVNLISGKSYNPDAELPEASLVMDPLQVSESLISHDMVVRLQGNSDITAMVVNISMPEELDFADTDCIQLSGEYAETHSVVWCQFGGGVGNTRKYFIIPKANDVFKPSKDGDNEIFRIHVYVPDIYNDVIGIKNPEVSIKAQLVATSGKSVEATASNVALPPKMTFAPGQQWKTFFSPSYGKTFVNGSGIKVYAVTKITQENVIVEEISGGIPASQMVLVGLDNKPTEETAFLLKSAEVPYYSGANLLRGTNQEETFHNPYVSYVLYNNEFVLNSGTSIPAGKGYIMNSAIENVSMARPRLSIVIGNEATGIRNIEDVGRTDWHDLQGRKLSSQPAAKGLYIKNGSKVIIK